MTAPDAGRTQGQLKQIALLFLRLGTVAFGGPDTYAMVPLRPDLEPWHTLKPEN